MHPSLGPRTMPQLQPQRLYAGLTLSQKLRTARDQRFERLFQINDVLDLRLEITSRPKAFARHKRSARSELPRQSNVEILHRCRSQTARETGARQAQQFTHAR